MLQQLCYSFVVDILKYKRTQKILHFNTLIVKLSTRQHHDLQKKRVGEPPKSESEKTSKDLVKVELQ